MKQTNRNEKYLKWISSNFDFYLLWMEKNKELILELSKLMQKEKGYVFIRYELANVSFKFDNDSFIMSVPIVKVITKDPKIKNKVEKLFQKYRINYLALNEEQVGNLHSYNYIVWKTKVFNKEKNKYGIFEIENLKDFLDDLIEKLKD
ncbi:MAG TPA: hypothetical protein EYH54_00020 [Nautiliaceae bacterium]|nr:hypothetical protein [Nautiliaceae bacterium]